MIQAPPGISTGFLAACTVQTANLHLSDQLALQRSSTTPSVSVVGDNQGTFLASAVFATPCSFVLEITPTAPAKHPSLEIDVAVDNVGVAFACYGYNTNTLVQSGILAPVIIWVRRQTDQPNSLRVHIPLRGSLNAGPAFYVNVWYHSNP